MKRLLGNLKSSLKINSLLTKKNQIVGYEADELVNVVIEKNIILREKLRKSPYIKEGDIRFLSYLATIPDQKIFNVLDFGGGGGNLHTIVQQFVVHRSFQWVVLDTPNLVAKANTRLMAANLKFISKFEEIDSIFRKIDIVIASSSIQYTSNPIETISKLVNLKANYVIFIRTPLLTKQKTLQFIQKSSLSNNGPGKLPSNNSDTSVLYPITILNIKDFEKSFYPNYEVILKVDEGKVKLGGIKDELNYYAYLFKRKV